ncbi:MULTISPECIES: tail fiber assembly protein [unclassified Variovorax]|uniref:tail fiber assembly protein n=1 Tax=unclassified Variovorax TaxID=663243 RepID=UPI003F46BC9D
MKKFSASTCGFYDDEIHEPDQIPADAVEIADDEYNALLDGQSAGKRIQAGPDGRPVLLNPPAPTTEQLAAKARADRDVLLSVATLRMDPLKDAVELDVATSAEVAALKAWREYRVALSRVELQTGFPVSVDWPKAPD